MVSRESVLWCRLATGFSVIDRIIYGIEDRLKSLAQFSTGGDAISVEMALNSRCTSDSDGNPRKFHWGMFNRTKKLSDEQIKKIIGLAKIPRFSHRKVDCYHFEIPNTVHFNVRFSSDFSGDGYQEISLYSCHC